MIPETTPTTCGDRSSFPAQSSVLDQEALFYRIVPLYDLPSPRTCEFLTRGDSDIYMISTDAGPYYLKIRRPPVDGGWCDAEARTVVDLASAGLPVVRPVRLKASDCYATELCASEGKRGVLIFEAAPPPLNGPLDAHQANQFGQMIGRLHDVSDRSPRHRGLRNAPIDALDTAVSDVVAAVRLSEAQQGMLQAAARFVKDRYAELSHSGSDYGVIHGDLALSNLRLTKEGRLTLFDFGAARRDWRVNELLNIWHRTLSHKNPELREQRWQAFLRGYAAVRRVPETLEEFKPVTHLSGKLITMGYICNALTLRLGIEPIEEHRIVEQVEEVGQLLSRINNGESASI
jgi:Ser/Thr protein kinase RdoA (MazF antagonist)